MRSACLAVTENKEAHTAQNYRGNVDEVLEDFKIKEKVVKTVTDNENKMRAAFNDDERSGCLAHITHNSVTEGIKQTPEIKDVIEKNRKIATKYHKSYAFKYNVEEEQKKSGLPVRAILQDVPTRWGSTRASTGSFLDKEENDEEEVRKSDVFREQYKNMDAINSALRKIKYKGDQKLSQYLLTEEDMARIATVNRFLTKLDIFSTTLGGDKYVTSSVLMPVIASMKKMMQEESSDPVYIARMKRVILEDFNKRVAKNIDTDFFLSATALDPRWKDLKMIKRNERDLVFAKIQREMSSLEKSNPAVEEAEVKNKPKRRLLDFDESDSDEESNEEDSVEAELKRFVKNKNISSSSIVSFSPGRFRNEPSLDKDKDPLEWWKSRKAVFPTLATLARKYFCVPATSTQAERVFSWMGFLLNKRRLCLSGDSVNMQLFLKDNIEL